MTILLIIFGVACVAISARLLAHAVALPRLRLKRHLQSLRDYGFDGGVEPEEAPARRPLKDGVRRLASRIGAFLMAVVPALRPLERGELAAAGYYETTPEAVHGYRALAAMLAVVLVGLVASGGIAPPLSFGLMAAGAALGWQLPAVLVRGRGRRRLDEIDKELPELIDLMIATVEAGLGFSGSLKLIADRLQGPLGDEVRLTISQQNLGITTSEALEDMLGRCDSLAMRAFVRTVVRGEAMGLSIAPILRELAVDMRRRRRQAAQERMHKAPVKILFPLMFLIMPALGIVLFYPAAYSVMNGMSSLH